MAIKFKNSNSTCLFNVWRRKAVKGLKTLAYKINKIITILTFIFLISKAAFNAIHLIKRVIF